MENVVGCRISDFNNDRKNPAVAGLGQPGSEIQHKMNMAKKLNRCAKSREIYLAKQLCTLHRSVLRHHSWSSCIVSRLSCYTVQIPTYQVLISHIKG